jgi:HAD superfamily hydrolase (TIGR01509 family)
MITTVVFDFDGVILDTETPDYQTWQDVFRSYGVDLDLSLWIENIGWGTSNFDVCGHLQGLTGLTLDRESLLRERRNRYLEIVNADGIMPGALDRLEEARRLGLVLGVASSSSRRWVEGHLDRLGILPMFDVVKTSDDVTDVKPNPELYLAAIHSLNALPEQTLAIEDSAHGVTAAKAAGLHCIAVPNLVTQHLPLHRADFRVASLKELSLTALLDQFGGPQRYSS